MKIGVLTFHNVHNFGASLQCYALMETMRELGHDTVIVDYVSPVFKYHKRKEKIFDAEMIACLKRGNIRTAIKYAKRINEQNLDWNRIRAGYKKFDKVLSLSKKVCNAQEINQLGLDCCIFGSDQIWTEAKGFDGVFWGKGLNTKNISYAASGITGNSEGIPYDELRQNFYKISVREKTVQKLLGKRNIGAELVLDPVLLAQKHILDRVIIKPKHAGKYVFVYNLGNDQETRRYAQCVAKILGLPILEVTGARSTYQYRENTYSCSRPEEFLGLLVDASYIVTNSFHGTALAIAYCKPFSSVLYKNKVRIPDLLAQFELSNRIVSDESVLKTQVAENINWDRVSDILSQKRKNSLGYLVTALQNI